VRDAEMYRSWIYVAEGVGYFKIEPRYKLPLIRYFQQYMSIQPNHFGISFSAGCPTVTLRMLVEGLQQVGCTSVRIQAYGMKLPLLGVIREPGNPSHPLAQTNTWDLGVMYPSSDIWMVKYRTRPEKPNREFPMLTPVGRGYGGADMHFRHPKGFGMQLKIYPRLIHGIKSFNSKMARTEPQTMTTARKRLTTVRRLIDDLGTVPLPALGGLRMEVSVTARTLTEATDALRGLPILSLQTFLDSELPWARPVQLRLTTVKVSDMLASARQLHAAASAHTAMKGRNHKRPSELSKKIVFDLLNSIGWNTGFRKPTRWTNRFAWWLREDLAPTVVQRQGAEVTIPASVDIQQLFSAVREHLPCRDCQQPGSRYHSVGGRQRFVLRCSDRNCARRMNRSETVAYLAQILSFGTFPVDLSSFGISVDPPSVASVTHP